MDVRELIEKLKEYPEDAEVQVRMEEDLGGFRGIDTFFKTPDEYDFCFYDFREGKSKYVEEGHPLFGKMILEIG